MDVIEWLDEKVCDIRCQEEALMLALARNFFPSTPQGTGSIDAVAINCDAVEPVFIGAGADGILDVRIVGMSEMRMCLGHMESSFQ